MKECREQFHASPGTLQLALSAAVEILSATETEKDHSLRFTLGPCPEDAITPQNSSGGETRE